MVEEHGISVKRACQAARLSRAAYYRPEADRSARDREIVEAHVSDRHIPATPESA